MECLSRYLKELKLMQVILGLSICICDQLNGQVKWDGEAGDGLWNSATNWVSNTVPSNSDDILLDNSAAPGNYSVTLPAGNSMITVRTLVIMPGAGKTIEVVLPFLNTAVPGFTALGSTYGLQIHPGGIFRNSSGASAGTPVDISDSIKVLNGGRYLHNTSRAHAANVTVLSRMEGTESGIFEFDVPGGSGYTVSIAGRVYGTLVLSANAAGGNKSYTSTGTTTVNVNGTFRLNPGVNYSLLFSGAFVVHNDFIHDGNIFDLSGGSANNRVHFRRDVFFNGLITETGTGSPFLEFDGSHNQGVSLDGSINGNISIRVNNIAGINLQSPFLVPYRVEFSRGNIRTTSANILIFSDNAVYTGVSENSFVDGPVRKIGDEAFEFPVGKQADFAPVAITGLAGNITDVFEAEYFLRNPIVDFGSTFEKPAIARVSALEYWRLERVSGTTTKKVVLNVRTYSDATLLEKLVVSRWDASASSWKSENNSSFTGIAVGSITSTEVSQFGVFTIASTVAEHNPLPVGLLGFETKNLNNQILISWEVSPGTEINRFELLRSANGIHFEIIDVVLGAVNKAHYRVSDKLATPGYNFYKLRILSADHSVDESEISSVFYSGSDLDLKLVAPIIRSNVLDITLYSPVKSSVRILIINAEGKIFRDDMRNIPAGKTGLKLNLPSMPAGVYYITGYYNLSKIKPLRLVKL